MRKNIYNENFREIDYFTKKIQKHLFGFVVSSMKSLQPNNDVILREMWLVQLKKILFLIICTLFFVLDKHTKLYNNSKYVRA